MRLPCIFFTFIGYGDSRTFEEGVFFELELVELKHAYKENKLNGKIIRGTVLGNEYEQHPEQFQLFTVDEYIDLVIEFINRLRADIYIDRFIFPSLRKNCCSHPIEVSKITNLPYN